jgi:hypothetical protein
MRAQHPTAIRLAAYAEGELNRSEANQVKLHVHLCPLCRAELAEMQALSARLQEFALPDGLGQDLWERVEQRLPERRAAPQPPPGGFLRWLPPIGLVASNAMLQAVLIVALCLWALSNLGLFDWPSLPLNWLPVGVQLPNLPIEEAISHLLSWLVAAPLGPGFDSLARTWGMDLSGVFSWLLPSALVFLTFICLALLYLSWLLAYWRQETRSRQYATRTT